MPRVVIIEDDHDLLEALVRQFRSDQFEVFAARNGREGLARITQVRPDLIVMDLLMPEMTGSDMMQELTVNHDWVQHIPVLVVTNYASGNQIDWRWENEAPVVYLIKSESSLEDIVARAKSLLQPQTPVV